MARAPIEGRRRYIGFRVDMGEGPPPERAEMVAALDAATRAAGLPDKRRLTVFNGTLGIARCSNLERGAMLVALGSIREIGSRTVAVTTIVTSGTIKNVKAHLGLDRRP